MGRTWGARDPESKAITVRLRPMIFDEIRHKVKDVDGLAQLFFDAAEVERKLPAAINLRVRGYWPDVPEDPNLAYGYNETEIKRGAASGSEVDLYDLALLLTQELETKDAKLVWMAAHSAVGRERGPKWRVIAKYLHIHPETARRRFERAIIGLWYKMLCGVDGVD